MVARILRQSLRISTVSALFFLANLRSFIFWEMYPDTSSVNGLAWVEIVFWLVLAGVIFYLLWRDHSLKSYGAGWSEQPLLLIFILFTALSVFWSISWTATLYRVLVLLFSSLFAAYLGVRSRPSDLLRTLFWFGAIVILASYLLAIFVPVLGRDFMPPYNGAWRGIFWHKNHLGSIAALLNLIYLIQVLRRDSRMRRTETILAIAFYLLSLILVYLADSVAGYFLVLIMHFVVLLTLLWLKFHSRLQRTHYYILLAIFLSIAFVFFSNMKYMFGLFNRNTSLTGRVPLWTYLLRDVFSQRPWFGQGFGALWTIEKFRLDTAHLVGWGYPVKIGDNGFLDILLHVGIIGWILFLGIYIQAWIKSIRYGLSRRTLDDFFPALFMVYTFFANLSYSLFLETEYLIWIVIIALLFIFQREGSLSNMATSSDS